MKDYKKETNCIYSSKVSHLFKLSMGKEAKREVGRLRIRNGLLWTNYRQRRHRLFVIENLRMDGWVGG